MLFNFALSFLFTDSSLLAFLYDLFRGCLNMYMNLQIKTTVLPVKCLSIGEITLLNVTIHS